jgi:Lar family restriction alleviation protein
MSAELLPCPFCGGEPSANGSIRYHRSHEAWFADGTQILEAFYVNCISCGISNRGLLGHQTREKAIAAWNRRSDAERRGEVQSPAGQSLTATPAAVSQCAESETSVALLRSRA